MVVDIHSRLRGNEEIDEQVPVTCQRYARASPPERPFCSASSSSDAISPVIGPCGRAGSAVPDAAIVDDEQ